MTYHSISNSTPSTPQPVAKVTVSVPTRVTTGLSSEPTNVLPTAGQKAPEGFHYMPDGTLMSDVEHQNMQCNSTYYHLFSMCHTGIEPYNFQQGSIIVWEGSSNFVSDDSVGKNLERNNVDFYFSTGQPEVGQTVGVTDKVGVSCMVYVGYIPFPIINPVKLGRSVISTNIFSDCSMCVSLSVKGCTNSSAVNYNNRATIDDGSCEYSNLPCKNCCVNLLGDQYMPTQPCICEPTYTLVKGPCVKVGSDESCKNCCYSDKRGIYHPYTTYCSCEEGDKKVSCEEVETFVEGEKCTNCCTNKSGRIFNPKLTERGCVCTSGSWSIACKGIEIDTIKTSLVENNDSIAQISVIDGITEPIKSLIVEKTSIDTCDKKIDTGFDQTLRHLPLTTHLNSIYGLSGGYNNSWDGYKFKYYPNPEPEDTKNLCLAIDNWSDVQDAYYAYIKSVKVIYTPEDRNQKEEIHVASNFSGLHSWTANTLSVGLDKTKGLWEAMEVWNNDTTIWTPGSFSITYLVEYCNCYDGNLQNVPTTSQTVKHVFGGTEGVYVTKQDNLVNYRCVGGTNPLVKELQQTCQPTTDEFGLEGVFDNVKECINSGCGGYMSCSPGTIVDGVHFEDAVYTPITMCCESLIKTSEKPLTKRLCEGGCKSEETWYPLYNAYHPNLMYESLLGYMTRDLLNKVNNRECVVSKDSKEFKSKGLKERLN